jgi:hypothetical protein
MKAQRLIHLHKKMIEELEQFFDEILLMLGDLEETTKENTLEEEMKKTERQTNVWKMPRTEDDWKCDHPHFILTFPGQKWKPV